MPALSEYTNVYGTVVAILEKKGFQVWYDEDNEMYGAEKDGWDFLSHSPCGLLGVVAIFEIRQPTNFSEYWWKDENPVDHRRLPRQPKPYTPVWKRNQNDK